MKTSRLTIFIAAILVPFAANCQTLLFTQESQCIQVNCWGGGIYNGYFDTGFYSFQDSYSSPTSQYGYGCGAGQNSSSSTARGGSVVDVPLVYVYGGFSFSGNGTCYGYNNNSYENSLLGGCGSCFFFTFTNYIPVNYFLAASLGQTVSPTQLESGSSVVLAGANINIVFGNSAAFNLNYGSGPLSGTRSGILEPGTYTIQGGTCLGFGTTAVPISANGSWNVVFILSPSNIVTTTVSGHITDAHGGLPITGATVQFGYVTAVSDANGYYSQSNLPPATYTVIASANNYISLTNTVTTSSSQTSVTQNFALSPLPKLDYFGVGVDWQNVTSPTGMNHVRGDISATNLYNHLFLDLPSIFNLDASVIVPLDATATSIGNLNIITAQFNQFTNKVWTNDTVVFYISTHAGNAGPKNGTPDIELSLASDFNSYLVCNANYVTSLLKSLPTTTRKVVILDCCYAMGVAYQLVDDVNNISVLAASSTNNEIVFNGIYYGGENVAKNDGTGVFTDCLISNLDNGIFDLHTISANITTDQGNVYAYAIGQALPLEDSGTAIFTGLQPQLYESSGFTGNLASNTVSVVQSPPKITQAAVVTNSFLMTLANVPSSGSIAIEVSKNLNSWMQVAFSPAAGTNLSYSFSVTNAPCQFFRTIVVP